MSTTILLGLLGFLAGALIPVRAASNVALSKSLQGSVAYAALTLPVCATCPSRAMLGAMYQGLPRKATDRRTSRTALLAAATAVLGLAACAEPPTTVCTALFAGYSLVITDKAGTPVDGVNLAVTLVRTGQRLSPQSAGLPSTGTYPLINDGVRDQLEPSGDQIHAVGTKGPATVQADFIFDVPGGCHVHKVSGPDTLALP